MLKQLDIDGSIHLDWRDLEDAMIALYIYLQTPTLNAPAFDIAKFSYVHTYRTNACKLAYTKLLFVRCVSTHNFIAPTRSKADFDALGFYEFTKSLSASFFKVFASGTFDNYYDSPAPIRGAVTPPIINSVTDFREQRP